LTKQNGLPDQQKYRAFLQKYVNVPFILLVSNTIASISLLLSCAELNCAVVILPKSRESLIGYVQRQTGINVVIDDTLKVDTNGHQLNEATVYSPGSFSILTSGTSGLPKITLNQWSHLQKQARVTCDMFLMERETNYRFIYCSSIGHAYAVNGVFMLPFLFAKNSHQEHQCCFASSASEVEELLSMKTPSTIKTVLFGTPALYASLLHSRSPLMVDMAFSAGTHLPHNIRVALINQFQMTVYQLYGSSEAGWVCHYNPLHAAEYDSFCDPMLIQEEHIMGTLYPGVSIRACDFKDGCLALDPALVALAVNTPWKSSGYVSNHGQTLTEHDPFYYTGDAGYIRDHTLIIRERLRKPIHDVCGEMNILLQPYQIEQKIMACPFVQNVLVVQDRDHGGMRFYIVAKDQQYEPVVYYIEQWTLLKPTSIYFLPFIQCSAAGKIMNIQE